MQTFNHLVGKSKQAAVLNSGKDSEMLNSQPRERIAEDVNGIVEVHSIWQTIQGEGPFAGEPAVFIRLAGCNLDCPLCDTDYTSHREAGIPQTVCDAVRSIRLPIVNQRRSLVVITGGEPFRQPIGELCNVLLDAGYVVQIETNGTLYRAGMPENKRLHIVCSPKTPKISEEIKPFITALKYVMAADSVDPLDGLPTKVLGQEIAVARPWQGFTGEVYLQPEDHCDPIRNKQNLEAVVRSCLKFGFRFCLQVHKYIGLE
jgi:7-carboxy-7-deazaguanine synthase